MVSGRGGLGCTTGRPRLLAVLLVVSLVGVPAVPAAAQQEGGGEGSGPLAGLTLVDASDQSVVATLVGGSSVVVADPGGGNYGFRVELVSGSSVGSVSLELSGVRSVGPKTENWAPYSLYGDYGSRGARRLNGEALPEGEYVLRAVAYAGRGLSGDVLGVLEVAFTVSAGEASEQAAVSSVLAPTGLSATATHRSVRLVWVAPHQPDRGYGDLSIDDMYVERREQGGAWSTLSWVSSGRVDPDTGEAEFYDTSGVVAGKVYEYRVRLEASRAATDGGGHSRIADTFSDAVAVTVESEPPAAAEGLGAVTRNGGVALSWTVPEQPSWAEVFSVRVLRTTSTRRTPIYEVGRVEWERGRTGYQFFDDTVQPGMQYRYVVSVVAGAVAADGHEVGTGGLPSAIIAVATPPAGSAAAGLTQGADAVAQLRTTNDGVPFIEFPADPVSRAAATGPPGPVGGDVFELSPNGRDAATGPSGAKWPPGAWGASSMQGPAGASSDDIASDLAGENLIAQAFWSDGTTIWVSARGSTGDWDGKIYAYTLSSGARDTAKDIDLALPASTDNPTQAGTSHGLWMDADTVWVTSSETAAILAYHRNADSDADPAIEAGARKSTADFTTLAAAGNANPMGIWADTSHIYVADADDAKIYVYDRSTKALERTIDTPGRPNDDPVGVWSDGATLWVSDRTDARVYAYRLDNGDREWRRDIKRRLSDADQRLSDDNDQPLAMWSDRSQLWVADADTTKVFVYNLPADARLRRFAIDGKDWIGDRRSERVVRRWTYVAFGTTQVTIDAKPLRSDAEITILPADADNDTDGHQVNVPSRGEVNITITVVQGPTGNRETLVSKVGIRVPPTPSGRDNRIRFVRLNGADLPGWDPVATEFAHEVSPDLTEVSLMAISNRGDLVVSIDGGPYRSGSLEQRVSLDADGSTTLTLKSNVSLVPPEHAQTYKLTLEQNGLRRLEVSGVNLDDFTPSVTAYARNVAADVTEVTVEAESIHAGATVAISPADADTNESGHQVSLDADGVTDITVTLTRDGESMKYTLKLTKLDGTSGTLSSDNTLSALSLSGVTLSPAFDPEISDYTYRLTNDQSDDGFTTTVTATPTDSDATATVLPADDDGGTEEHQIDIDGGGPAAVTVTVTPQDGSPAKVYTVHLQRTRRDTSKDLLVGFYLDYGELLVIPYDIWSDGDTMWVLSSGLYTMHAFDLDSGDRQSQQDIQRSPEHSWYDTGLWADGDTMWVAQPWINSNSWHPYIEAIDMASSKSTAVHIDTESFFDTLGPRDLWSDGETIWVASVDGRRAFDSLPKGGKLQAFDFATKARKPDRDITVTTTGDSRFAASNRVSFALWSDGTVMWVASNEGDATSRLEAYALSDGARVPGMDIPVGADGVTHPRGLWSDGRTMWVLDVPYDSVETRDSAGIRAFSLPANAKLHSLTMSDVDFGHFIHGKPDYTAEVANSVSTTTVDAVAAFDRGDSAVAITAADSDDSTEDVTEDADDKTEGYQVNLATGVNTITIEVTAPNGTDTYTYTVTITRAS